MRKKSCRPEQTLPAEESPLGSDQVSIHISIDSKGNILLETVGTRGKQCDLLAGALEANLGNVSLRANKETYEQA